MTQLPWHNISYYQYIFQPRHQALRDAIILAFLPTMQVESLETKQWMEDEIKMRAPFGGLLKR